MLSTPGYREVRQPFDVPSHRCSRKCIIIRYCATTYDRVGFGTLRDKIPVIYPLGLHELELPAWIGIYKSEHQPPVQAVIFRGIFRQNGTIGRSALQQPVQPCVGSCAVKGIPWVHPPDMAANRGNFTVGIGVIGKIIVAQGICNNGGIVFQVG